MKKHTAHVITVAVTLGILAIGAGAFAYSGLYNIGADDHHTKPVFAVLQTLRDRSIHVRSEELTVPNLDDPQLILKGAGQYAAMCTSCHLSPGVNESELRVGMYPQPPNLSKVHVDPKDAFWVIKHGIKMSAMPAWGKAGHDDPTIWSMVAFLEKLPGMTPAEYKAIVAKAPPDEDMDMDMDSDSEHSHSHGGAEHGEPPSDSAAAMGKRDDDASSAVPDATGSGATVLKAGAAPEAEATAQDFLDALRGGNRVKLLALLAPDAQIREGSETQSAKQYAGHHMGEDMAFLRHNDVTVVARTSSVVGDTARVVSETNISGTSNGQTVRLRNREQMGLKRIGSQWKIVSIYWTSQPLTE